MPDQSTTAPSLAVSEAKDSTLKTPHAVLIDLDDFPVGVIYGHDSDEAEALAEQFVRAVNSHFALVAALERLHAASEAMLDKVPVGTWIGNIREAQRQATAAIAAAR